MPDLVSGAAGRRRRFPRHRGWSSASGSVRVRCERNRTQKIPRGACRGRAEWL